MTSRNPDLCENSGEQAMPVTNSNLGGVAPQATSTVGIPEPPPSTIEATGAVGAVTVLNPFGPTNQLNQGAVVFAYPDLIYDQFIDVNQQIEITDDTSPGTLILQIPYHPISDYTNQYIQNYAALHGRYNGDILVRAQIIGNSTFSGTLIWFWYPTRYPNAIVDMSAAQKYSYKTQSVVLPSVEEFVLKDARQYQYYRDMSDTDINSRPHLCLAVHTSVVSPLREGIRVRMRIGTRLASRTDVMMGKPVQPFMFADPQIVAYNPTPSVENLNGRPLSVVFPHYAVNDLFMYADGISTLPSYSTVDSNGVEIPYNVRMSIPSLLGGAFPQAANQRCYTVYLDNTSSVTTNTLRIVMVNHQFPSSIEKSIATDSEFVKLPTTSTWLADTLEATAIQRYVTVYVIRNNSASVELFSSTNPALSLDMVQQTSCLSNYGRFVITCLTYTFPGFSTTSTVLTDLEPLGVPNTAAGIPAYYPTNGVLGPVTFTQNLVALPSSWVALKLTGSSVTIVSNSSDLAPTTLTETDLLVFFDRLSNGLTVDQCLQFDLVNPESRTRVATLRYLPSRRDFVINPISPVRYAAFNGSVVSLIIANYGIVPTASTFPATDLSVWSSRVAANTASLASRMRGFMPFVRPNSVRSPVITTLHSIYRGEEEPTKIKTLHNLYREERETPTITTLHNIYRGEVRVNHQGMSQVRVNDEPASFSSAHSSKVIASSVITPHVTLRELSRMVGVLDDEEEEEPERPRPSKFSRQATDTLYSTSYALERMSDLLKSKAKTIPKLERVRTNLQGEGSKYFEEKEMTPKPMSSYIRNIPGVGHVSIQQGSVNDVPQKAELVSVRSDGASSTFWQGFLDDWGFEPLKPMSLSTIFGMVNSPMTNYKPNALAAIGSIAASSLSSMIGSGINWAHDESIMHQTQGFVGDQNEKNRQQALAMQQAGFQNSQNLQNADIMNKQTMQSRDLANQRSMQQNSFNQQTRMQQADFRQQKDMASTNYGYSKDLLDTGIAGNIMNTATGGMFSLATSALNTAGSAYLSHQNYENQSNLINQKANADIQNSGAGAAALRLSSNR